MYISSSHVLQASKFPVIKSMGSVDSSRKFRNNIIISYLAFQMPTMYSTSMPATTKEKTRWSLSPSIFQCTCWNTVPHIKWWGIRKTQYINCMQSWGVEESSWFMKALIFHWHLRMDKIWVRLNGMGGLLMFPNERKGIHLGN